MTMPRSRVKDRGCDKMYCKGLNDYYSLENSPLGQGGEGDIFRVAGKPNIVAKIYYPGKALPETEKKLRIMVSRPPDKSVLSQVAWPLDLLYDAGDSFCGFIMPCLRSTAELLSVYPYPPQSNISLRQKLIVAQNICVVISAVHEAGYVFGDFNPRNIGVDLNTGAVAFFDTDSYHIKDPLSGETFRCGVCMDGYVAPELLKKCEGIDKDAYLTAPLPTFTVQTDDFALAIHIFKLLMNGYTPFNGIAEDASRSSSTASPGVGNQAVKRGSYCFKPGKKPQSAAVLPLSSLPKELGELFSRAFILGEKDSAQRPSADEWREALSRYEECLTQCAKDPAHQYLNTLRECPLCEADRSYQKSVNASSRPSREQKRFTTPVTVPSGSTNPPAPATITGSNTGFGTGAAGGTNRKRAASGSRPVKEGKNYTRNPVWDVILCILKGLGFGYLATLALMVLSAGGMLVELIISVFGIGIDYSTVLVIPVFIGAAVGIIRGIWRNTNK